MVDYRASCEFCGGDVVGHHCKRLCSRCGLGTVCSDGVDIGHVSGRDPYRLGFFHSVFPISTLGASQVGAGFSAGTLAIGGEAALEVVQGRRIGEPLGEATGDAIGHPGLPMAPAPEGPLIAVQHLLREVPGR